RQRRDGSVRMLLELHEDEVPELEEALAARTAGPAVGLAAADLLAAVVVHLGIPSARPRTADGPEVLRRRQGDDPLGRLPDRLPEADCIRVLRNAELRVARKDAHPHAVHVEAQMLGHELPGELDRTLFEVLP